MAHQPPPYSSRPPPPYSAAPIGRGVAQQFRSIPHGPLPDSVQVELNTELRLEDVSNRYVKGLVLHFSTCASTLNQLDDGSGKKWTDGPITMLLSGRWKRLYLGRQICSFAAFRQTPPTCMFSQNAMPLCVTKRAHAPQLENAYIGGYVDARVYEKVFTPTCSLSLSARAPPQYCSAASAQRECAGWGLGAGARTLTYATEYAPARPRVRTRRRTFAQTPRSTRAPQTPPARARTRQHTRHARSTARTSSGASPPSRRPCPPRCRRAPGPAGPLPSRAPLSPP